MQRGGLDHVDSCFGATSMRLESVSVRVLTRDFHHGVRHHEAVMASAVGTTVRDHEKFLVFLRFIFTPFRPAPYLSCDYHYQWQCLLVGGVWESVEGGCGIARLLLAVVYCRTREGATQMMCVAKTGKTASAIL